MKKIYPQCIKGKLWSAIQMTTASSLCAVADLVLAAPQLYRGFITQESFALQYVLKNRFGSCYR